MRYHINTIYQRDEQVHADSMSRGFTAADEISQNLHIFNDNLDYLFEIAMPQMFDGGLDYVCDAVAFGYGVFYGYSSDFEGLMVFLEPDEMPAGIPYHEFYDFLINEGLSYYDAQTISSELSFIVVLDSMVLQFLRIRFYALDSAWDGFAHAVPQGRMPSRAVNVTHLRPGHEKPSAERTVPQLVCGT